jgi:hypothetical protein
MVCLSKWLNGMDAQREHPAAYAKRAHGTPNHLRELRPALGLHHKPHHDLFLPAIITGCSNCNWSKIEAEFS